MNEPYESDEADESTISKEEVRALIDQWNAEIRQRERQAPAFARNQREMDKIAETYIRIEERWEQPKAFLHIL